MTPKYMPEDRALEKDRERARKIASAITSGWQDGSTAPKDGSYILAWNGECHITFWAGKHWSADDDVFYFTHWMPLPAGPKDA